MSIENQRLKQFSKAFTIATCRFRPTIARPSNSYIKTLDITTQRLGKPSIQLFIGINICNIVFHMYSSKFQQSYYDQLLCYSKSQLKWFWQDAHVQHFWTLAWYSIYIHASMSSLEGISEESSPTLLNSSLYKCERRTIPGHRRRWFNVEKGLILICYQTTFEFIVPGFTFYVG